MKSIDYLYPAIAAISVTILSPLYWIFELSKHFDSSNQDYSVENLFASDMSLSSFMFLLIGLLSIYIYSGLIRLLHDHYNYKKVDVILMILIFICTIFYFGTFLLETLSFWSGEDINGSIISLLWISCLIAFGIMDILLAIVLLKDSEKLSSLIKGFAIVNLVLGIIEITVMFSFIAIFLFPVATALLAMIFLRKPETIEIV